MKADLSLLHRLRVLWIGALVGAACAGPETKPPAPATTPDPPPAAQAGTDQDPQADLPSVPEFIDDDEWIRLKSGEWLKGEFKTLNRDSVEFESDELDNLSLDWKDIDEVITTRPYTLVKADRVQVVGDVRIQDGEVYVHNGDQVTRFPRKDLMRMIPLGEGLANWSGSVRLAATRRSGNTDQTDTSATMDATHRSPDTRTKFYFDHVFSEVNDTSVADNQTLRGSHDRYLSPRFYLTPLGFEVFRDPFQNIALRATPYSGAGYTLIDQGNQEWNADVGLGYRYTRFDSVAAGMSDTQGSGALIFNTDYDVDLTTDVDFNLAYQLQLSLRDTTDSYQEFSAGFSLDFVWDLDLDVRFLWKYVGSPEPNSDGTVPLKNDFRWDFGLSWEF